MKTDMRKKYYMMIKILASTITGIIGGSMLVPLLAIRLKEAGHSESEIGLFASLSWIAMLFASPFAAKVISKFGYRKTYIVTGLISLLYAIGLYTIQNYYFWCAISFLIGFVWATRWITTETFINAIAPDDKRGKFIGVYGSLIWIAIAIGPALLLLTGTKGDTAFYVSMVMFTISFFLNLLVKDIKGVYDAKVKTKLRMWSFFKANKFVFIISLLSGIFENGLNPISVLYALSLGITADNAPFAATCIGIGALAIQYPSGWIADKFKKQNHYLTFSLFLLIGNLLMFFAILLPSLVYFSNFAWGIFGPAIYVIMMTWMGNKYKKNDLVAVTSYLIFGYTLGGVIAPIISGIAMDIYDIFGLPILLTVLTLVITISSATMSRKYIIK